MILDDTYMKYIKGRINPVTLVKSQGLSGTMAAVYRVFHLKNNYCLYDNDRILYLTKNKDLLDMVKKVYNNLKGESELDYITLFSFIDDRVDFMTIDDIVDGYFKKHILKNPEIRIIDESEREKLVEVSLDKIFKEYSGLKFFNNNYIKFLSDEIKWMKSLDYTEFEVYQNCPRSGRGYKKGEGPGNIRKNSRGREGIFKLFTLYEDKLKENNLIDIEDKERIAFNEIKENNNYTHIIVDEAIFYTKMQLEITRILASNRVYGETTYVYDLNNEFKGQAFLNKTNKVSEIHNGNRIKSYNLKTPLKKELLEVFNNDIKSEASKIMEIKNERTDSSIEKLKFISLKNGSEFEFIRDITRKDSIVLIDGDNQEEIGSNEIKELPVFSDIAAGEPILMNPDSQDTFYLPEYWVRGMDNHFILHVKGDSMINADINDGDFVVIKSTQAAQNRDIVAVNIDGSATLKRLLIKGKTAVLMPENERYSPIVITEEGAQILGVAVGLIKENFSQ